jgi:hypothetical protein
MKPNLSWSSGSNNKKAFVFTLDVAVAMIIVFALLSTASYFVVKKSQDPFPTLQLVRTGSDLVRLMDYRGLFDNPDQIQISNYLLDNLPPQYEMYIEGHGSSINCDFISGSNPPHNKAIGSGKEFFMTAGGEYCTLRYKLWLK